MNYKYQKGFTLIELLLVVGIVTVLSSLFLFNATEAKNKAQDSHMASESHEIENAINMYKDQNNGFVPLSSSVTSGTVYTEDKPEYKASLQPLVDSGFISEIPHSPDGKSYAYGFSADGQEAIFVANFKTTKSNRSSSNSCNVIKQKIEINWSAGMNIIKTGDGLYTAYCNELYSNSYYCPAFSGMTAGKSLLKTLCMESFYKNEFMCNSYVEDQFYYFYRSGDDTLFFGRKSPKPVVCDGSSSSEYCTCI